jgi:hypothetical protein
MGPSWRQACAFLCDRGALANGPVLDYPPASGELQRVLDECDALAVAHGGKISQEDCLRMGLVAAYLFSEDARRGLVLARHGLTAQGLGEAIMAAADALKLRLPRKRGAAAKDPPMTTE